MPEPHTPPTPPRRVGVYERLGRTGSPAKLIGIGVVVLIIVIAIIIALTR
jgi:hypothetical protein